MPLHGAQRPAADLILFLCSAGRGVFLTPKHAIDRLLEPGGVALRKVALRAHGKRGKQVRRFVAPGQHEVLEPRPAPPRLAHKLQAVHSRQGDIHQRQIGLRLRDLGERFLGAGRRAADLGIGQGGYEPDQGVAHGRVVLDDEDSRAHRDSSLRRACGTWMLTRAPPPGFDSTPRLPPKRLRRSRRLFRPKCSTLSGPKTLAGSKPPPSSVTSMSRVPSVRLMSTVACCAPACFTTLKISSRVAWYRSTRMLSLIA